jgi:hypothetical protein
MNTEKDTQDTFDRYRQAADKWHDLYTGWVKGIIVISAGLVSVLVSLRQNKSETQLEHILFSMTIISLTLGILTGVILLHRQIKLTGMVREWYFGIFADKLLYGEKQLKADFLEAGILYTICEYAFYAFSIISLLSLTSYAILKDSVTVY